MSSDSNAYGTQSNRASRIGPGPDGHSHPNGTNLARARTCVGPQDECTPCAPDGPNTERNGFQGSRAGAPVGPQDGPAAFPSSADHWGSVPDDEREALASGFGAELIRLRKASALSQTRLGDLAGLRGGHIGRLERGQRRPSVAAVIAIARIVAPEAQREAVQTRLASLAGTSLREGAARKKHAKDNKHRRAALAAAERAHRQMQSIIRAKEARGELVAGNLRSLAEKTGEVLERLKSEAVPEFPAIAGVPNAVESLKRRWDRPRSRSRKDLEAWLDSRRSELSERFEDDDDE